jgi:hypothetical protein
MVSIDVVRIKNTTIAVNNRAMRVRNLRIAGGTRRNNKKGDTIFKNYSTR